MNQLALITLLGWPVVALVLFAVLPPRRAVIATYMGAWLLLPFYAAISTPGLPDYTKFTAGTVGALLGIVLFDLGRLTAFRPRWFDLPMLVWCLSPMVTSLLNGLGAYDGLSSIFTHVVQWGAPYLAGRLYFSRPEHLHDLALGLAIGGLIYVPLIVYEVGARRSLSQTLYGRSGGGGYKYGLYSPVVFAFHTLELALWMTLSALAGYWLWVTGAVRQLLGVPFGLWTMVLVGGALLCHQTAAMMLLLGGMALIGAIAGSDLIRRPTELLMWATVPAAVPEVGFRKAAMLAAAIALFMIFRRGHPRWIAWGLIAIAPLYITTRSTGLWGGQSATSVAYAIFGAERGWSLQYRMINEDVLVNHALKHPIFGWGGFGRNRPEDDKENELAVTDGLWVIHLGQFGLVGLGAFYSTLVLAQIAATRHSPPDRWSDPRLAPAGALCLVLAFYSVDSMLNAAPGHPAIGLIAGGLITLSAAPATGTAMRRHRQEDDPELAWADRLAATGRSAAAEAAYRHFITTRAASGSAGWASLAVGYDHLAGLLAASGRQAEAEPARRQALALREELLIERSGDLDTAHDLAFHYERLARELTAAGEVHDALPPWERSLQLRAAIAAALPGDPDAARNWADGLNDLAWLLANGSDPDLRDPARAVELARQAVALGPHRKTYWNSLGAAYYRLGAWDAAIEALGHSLRLGDDGAGFDYAILALAHRNRGEADLARDYRRRLDDWIAAHQPSPPSLLRLRDEATATTGPPAPIAHSAT